MTPDRFTIYRDTEGRWRWRCVAGNGKVVADSGQGYSRRIDCVRGLESVAGDEVEWDFNDPKNPLGRLFIRRTMVWRDDG